MFTVIREYHALLRQANLKAAPDKTKFFLRKVKFLGHVIISKGTQPSNVAHCRYTKFKNARIKNRRLQRIRGNGILCELCHKLSY